MNLVTPSTTYQESYLSYIKELGNEERYPFTLDLEFEDFTTLLNRLEDYSFGRNLPEGTVQNTTLWLVDVNEIVGVTNVRHYLNEVITHCGGHIGLSIRPSQRGNGLGNLLIQLSIDHLKKLGVHHIHIHCYKGNEASSNAILHCGGKLDSEIEVDNHIVQRYIKTND